MHSPEDLAPLIGVSDRTLRRWCKQRLVRSTKAALRGGRVICDAEAEWVDRWGMRLAAALRVLRVHPQVSLVAIIGRAADQAVVLEPGEPIELLVSFADQRAYSRVRQKLERAFGRPVRFLDYRYAVLNARTGMRALESGRPLVDRSGEWTTLLRQRGRFARELAGAPVKVCVPLRRN